MTDQMSSRDRPAAPAARTSAPSGRAPGGSRYRWILIDADDTIFDFGRCQREALSLMLREAGVEPTDAAVAEYDAVNKAVWKALERGEITKDVLVWKRFELFFDRMGYVADPVAMSSRYEELLSRCAFELPGAAEACAELGRRYGIYVITNGIERVQRSRFRDSGLDRLFDGIFISGAIGHNKPSAGFFEAVAAAIPGFDPSQALVVGDSLTSDIKGGIAFGADTCWIDPEGRPVPEGMDITYVLPSLAGLPEMLSRAEAVRVSGRLGRIAERLAGAGVAFAADYPLSGKASFRIGGPADIAVFPAGEAELAAAVRILTGEHCRFFVAGNASNLLFDDAGFRGAVIFTTGMRSVRTEGDRLFASAGDSLASVCRAAADAGLAGMEFAYGIPGTVGGAVRMNAGAYGGQMSDILESVSLLDSRTGGTFELPAAEMELSYRHSLVCSRPELIITGAAFRLRPGLRSKILEAMDGYAQKRREKQPLEYPSAGSVFKRPAPDVFVGRLIEDAGLKGLSVGGARVSEKHAGFIVNTGGATSSDVNGLIRAVEEEIMRRYGIRLECEIIRVPETEDA
jgi:UDP-N-acetylmuramate dehydrogenase